VIVSIIRRKIVLTHASIVLGRMHVGEFGGFGLIHLIGTEVYRPRSRPLPLFSAHVYYCCGQTVAHLSYC